jgi:hypothetical protein
MFFFERASVKSHKPDVMMSIMSIEIFDTLH